MIYLILYLVIGLFCIGHIILGYRKHYNIRLGDIIIMSWCYLIWPIVYLIYWASRITDSKLWMKVVIKKKETIL